MRSFILAALGSLFALSVHAQYQPLYQSLLNQNLGAFQDAALSELRQSESVQKNRGILRTLLSQEKRLYDVQDFDSKIIPFNEGGCLPGEEKASQCGTHHAYTISLMNIENGQKLILSKDSEKLMEYETKARLKLTNLERKLGTVVHLIFPLGSRENYFFLVREIEHIDGTPVKETINIFKVEGSKACQIAESDFTLSDDHYDLFSVFIRSLGAKITCGQDFFRI